MSFDNGKDIKSARTIQFTKTSDSQYPYDRILSET